MPESRPSEAPPRKSRVLVVDDEEPNRQLLSALLSAQGFQVFTARDGPSALAQLQSADIDLMLLDVMMPGMDGMEVCRRVRQELALPELIIVFVTALSDRESRMRAKAAGANDFLVKPVDSFELTFRAHQWLKLGHLRDLTERRAELEQGLLAVSELARDVAAQLTELAIEARGSAREPNQAGSADNLSSGLARAVERLTQASRDSQQLASRPGPQLPPHAPATASTISAAPRNHQS
jgi:CheY-like chemotaxis protein